MVITRKNLTDKERQAIYEALLLRSMHGKLKRRTTTIVANLFNVNRCCVQSIWRTAKKCLAEGVPVDVSCKRKKNCGRKKVAIDMSRIATIPFVAGFLGYPQPGGGAHPPIPREGVLGDELGDWADLALGGSSQEHTI